MKQSIKEHPDFNRKSAWNSPIKLFCMSTSMHSSPIRNSAIIPRGTVFLRTRPARLTRIEIGDLTKTDMPSMVQLNLFEEHPVPKLDK
ncbi:MAG: hypothetical protein HKP10_03790 [Kiritimatiellales bacterium]|nr:hypothetical protein [Kiritimatiellales bacterium]